MTGFAHFDTEVFLREYWQRKPLLIRGALPDFEDPLEPGELASLAMEDCVDARIVETCADGWGFRQGPFTDTEFDAPVPWTLLVQKVDHYLESIAELRLLVDFLPSWRFDDVMVSYAEKGAGVGPHYDNYDVFLVQGMGSRKWRLGQTCGNNEPLTDHPNLRILDNFEDSYEYTLQPGDVLYIPPRLAHWGTAESASLTYSLGFRAPRINDMISRWVDSGLENMNGELFYSDPPINTQRPGEITAEALTTAREQLVRQLHSLESGASWFGELVTDGADDLPAIDVSQGDSLMLEPAARLAWKQIDQRLELYANGQTLLVQQAVLSGIKSICAGATVIAGEDLDLAVAAQLAKLGCLAHAEDDV